MQDYEEETTVKDEDGDFCLVCGGSGKIKCTDCGGQGYFWEYSPTLERYVDRDCTSCVNGYKDCWACGGK